MNNYNLIRLANLYGGMNKSAADDYFANAQDKDKAKDLANIVQALKTNRKAPEEAALVRLPDNALTNPDNTAAYAGSLSSDFSSLDPASVDSITTISTKKNQPLSLRDGLLTDPALVGEVMRTEPALGYTLGTEEQAMRLYRDELAKDPSLWEKIKEWIAANPGKSTAIGAGALGLGGLGAYAMMRDKDEEEEGRKKTASYIDPYVAQVLAHDYITKMASANGIPTVAAGVTGVSNYLNLR